MAIDLSTYILGFGVVPDDKESIYLMKDELYITANATKLLKIFSFCIYHIFLCHVAMIEKPYDATIEMLLLLRYF